MTEDIQTNNVLMGRYQVQKELGRGGMGAVYLAHDLQHRRPVAIKVARLPGPEARAQFRREALYLQKLHHHSLPRIWDTFSDTQQDYLVMEYIPGEDLETLVQLRGPQPEWLVLRWADELLDVLDYLHTQTPPIIHRDVKPGNLKLRQNETLVLVDFGIAKEYLPGETNFTGATAVTPGYSPPEQYSDSLADERSDVYSAGATMFFMLTGTAPAAAPDRAAATASVPHIRQLAPKTSEPTDSLVHKALSLSSDERWANAAEMRRAVAVASRRLIGKAPASSPEPVSSVDYSTSADTNAENGLGKGQKALAALAGLAAIAFLALAAFLWTSDAGNGTPVLRTQAGAAASTLVNTDVSGDDRPQPSSPPAVASTATAARPTPTASAGRTSTSSATPKPKLQATSHAVVVALVLSPTSTPKPTRTPTPGPKTPTATPTQTPAALRSTATAFTTQRATAAPPTVTATSVPKPTAKPATTQSSAIVVDLLQPGDGAVGGGVQVFRWQAAQSPSDGRAFELVFWRPGQDPMRDAFGPVGTTQARSEEMQVDLDAADVALGALIDPGDYYWGVLLVEASPYQRIALISEPRLFRYERASGSQDGGGAPPDATLPPF